MDIDLQQLPIPDWGLVCPQCSYPLRGLPGPRCPECGLEIDIAELVRPWTRLRAARFTGNELPLPDFGLNCGACGKALAGAGKRACPHCQAEFDPLAWQPTREWFIVDGSLCGPLPVPGVQALLAAEGIPYVQVNEKTFREIYGGQSIFATRLRAPSEFYFEILWLLRRAQQDMNETRAARESGQSVPWRCPGCGAKNPPNFDICWKCQGSHNGT